MYIKSFIYTPEADAQSAGTRTTQEDPQQKKFPGTVRGRSGPRLGGFLAHHAKNGGLKRIDLENFSGGASNKLWICWVSGTHSANTHVRSDRCQRPHPHWPNRQVNGHETYTQVKTNWPRTKQDLGQGYKSLLKSKFNRTTTIFISLFHQSKIDLALFETLPSARRRGLFSL